MRKLLSTMPSKLCLLLAVALYSPISSAQGELDFSGQTTPSCEVAGLVASPPTNWINVPINTGIEQLLGCQMMLIVEQELIGVLRVLSFDWSNAPSDLPPWPEHVMTVESVLISEMGYNIKELSWARESVPVSGPGFGNGQVAGFATEIVGNPIPQESQMLVFDRGNYKYLVNMLTPAKSVANGEYYSRNMQGMGELMQSFKLPLEN